MPRSFTDSKGRSWELSVDVSTIKRVRALLDVDLLDAIGGKLIGRLIEDPILLGDVVYAVCKPQADAAGVSAEQFGEGLAGDVIDQATGALLDGIVSFCPSPRDRKALGQVLAKTTAAMDKARDLVEHRLESGAVDRAIEAAIGPLLTPPPPAPPPEETPGPLSGGAPASPASTPPT